MSERNEGGLWCREGLALLDRYVDGSLEERELAAVSMHVRGCENCARFGGAYARVVAALRADPPAPPGDAGRLGLLTARVLAGIE
jgi:anti-sigma factor RsiW